MTCPPWRRGRRRRWTPGSRSTPPGTPASSPTSTPARSPPARAPPSRDGGSWSGRRAGDLSWCVTAFPCDALAQDADMSLADYEDFVYRAGWMHLADPAAAWRYVCDKLPGSPRGCGHEDAAHGRRGHRPPVGVGGRTGTARTGAQLPRRRGVHGPGRVRDVTATCASRSRPLWRPRGAGRAPALRGRPGGQIRGAAGGAYSSRCWRWIDGASVLGEFAIGTNYQVTQLHEADPVRREDRRHRATWRSAPATPRPAASTARRCTGTWSATCARGGEIYADGELIYRTGRSCPRSSPAISPQRRPRTPAPAPRISQPIVATWRMNGRSCTRSTAAAEVRRDRDDGGRALEADSGRPSGSAVTSLCDGASRSG